MSNLTHYNLTKTLHTLAQEKAKKHGLELRIKGFFIWHYEHFPPSKNLTAPTGYFGKFYNDLEVGFTRSKDDFLAIEADQIRQILVAFKNVLERKITKLNYKTRDSLIYLLQNPTGAYPLGEKTKLELIDFLLGINSLPGAETLCQKWLDGLNPLFTREPETVLTELINVLEII